MGEGTPQFLGRQFHGEEGESSLHRQTMEFADVEARKAFRQPERPGKSGWSAGGRGPWPHTETGER